MHRAYIGIVTRRQLKALRESIGYSQARLARVLGVDVMTVSRWETGVSPITTVIELALRTVVREAKVRGKTKYEVTNGKSTRHLSAEGETR